MNTYAKSSTLFVPLVPMAERILSMFEDSLLVGEGFPVIPKHRQRAVKIINEPIYFENSTIRVEYLIDYLLRDFGEVEPAVTLVNEKREVVFTKRFVERAKDLLQFPDFIKDSRAATTFFQRENAFILAECFIRKCFAEFSAYEKPVIEEHRIFELLTEEYDGEMVNLNHSGVRLLRTEYKEDLEIQFGYIKEQIRQFQLFGLSKDTELPIEPEWLTYEYELLDQREVMAVTRGRDYRVIQWEKHQRELAEKAAEDEQQRRCT